MELTDSCQVILGESWLFYNLLYESHNESDIPAT